MSADQWVKLITLLTSFVQVIIWPFVVLAIALYLRKPISKFIGEMNELNLKTGSTEIVAKSKQAEIAVSLEAATTQIQNENLALKQPSTIETPREIAKLVNQTVTPQTVHNLKGVSILWVDDVPSNNTFIRHAMETLDIRFTICASTEEAIKELNLYAFDAIISDMGRPPDSQAGFTLLDKVKEMRIKSPFIIYARGGNKQENKEEAQKRGAYESVSGPQGLYKCVIDLFSTPGKVA